MYFGDGILGGSCWICV